MSRYPVYLTAKEIPDQKLLNVIKKMIKEGKGPKKIKEELSNEESSNEELPNISLYSIRRYYTKIRKGTW
jgi:hypothetical protein